VLRVASLVAAFLLCASAYAGAALAADRLTLIRAERPFTLDPTLSDSRWGSALAVRRMTDLGTRLESPSETETAVFYDDRNLYVGFKLKQSAAVTATQGTNNIGFGIDDFVGIGIDPVGNAERSYWFETTPRGTRYQQASESARFLPEWYAAGTAGDGGWSAMMIIPLKIIHVPANGPQHWKINFERYTAARGQRETWSFDPLMANYPIGNFPDWRESRWWPVTTGMVLDGVVPKPRPKGELFALGSGGTDHNVYTTPSGATYRQNARALGVDASYPITPTVNLVAALSPDFSNVEIDQQTIAPQQFRRNFREYRPFFAQGANYINTEPEGYEFNFAPDAIFYSPSIGPFDRGLKMVGTQGNNSFGALEVAGDDPTGPNRFDDLAFGWRAHRPNNALSVWADGVMAHHSGIHDTTLETGFYGRSLASGLVYSVNHAFEVGSAVKNPSRAQKTSALFDIQKSGPFEATIGWNDIGPQYNPIDGFTNISDVRGPNAQLSWTIPSKVSWIKSYDMYLYADRWLDSQGQVHEADADAYFNIHTKKLIGLNFGYQNGSQRTYGGNYFSGYYNDYADAVTLPFHAPFIGLTVGEGAPNSIAANYQWGSIGNSYLQGFNTTTIYQLGRGGSFEFDYAGTLEKPTNGGAIDSQWLRRVTFGVPLGRDGNASFSYRVISGYGGFALPGRNLAVGLRKRFASGNEIFINYGTPAATTTLDRLIVKYLIRVGGGL
jgi:hypothetical protein